MDNVTINVLDSKGNVVMLTVSKDIAERMQNDQMFLSSVMEKVSAVETKASAPLLPLGPLYHLHHPPSTSQCPITTTRPPVPPPPSTSQCLITTTRPPVPPPPSTSQCPITTTRPPVLLTSTVKDPLPSTLQPGAVCGNPSASIQPSSPSFQSDRHESQGIALNTLMDELFGSSGIGTAPPGTIHSTPLGLEETSSTSRPTTSSLQDQPVGASMDEQPGTATIQNANITRRQRRPQPLQFLDAYEEHAERRTAVLESLVRPDLERWRRLKERRRRSFEKKMVTSLGTIVEELKKMGKRQEQIMHLLQNPHEPQ
ncbi:hypothetical protein DPX16_4609 [Anabarilius grahami]|uniref:Uncharacterized protein n=1 Tax=Anabarilius grahami TaxID=495550 RepID=A0A3N0YC08_ANAGA|nr:hypothetical protein DPX16_4609 [Anabarilius grahami]